MDTPLYFDCRYLRINHHDGISRFTAGLFEAVSHHLDTVAIISDERQLSHLPANTKWVRLNDPTHWSEPLAALKLNRIGAKLVYSPMQTMGSFGRRFKLALTLHDLIYYKHPTPPPSMPFAVRIGWRVFHFWYWPQRLLLNGSDAVVTVSQTTAQLIARHRLTKRPVSVVYNATGDLDPSYEHAPPTARPRQKQDLVYMGSFMGYKNVATLVLALNRLPGYTLHLLSKVSDADQSRLRRLAVAGGGELVFHNGVTDSQYHQLLDSAVALVHASHEEGFGIPLIEAMARGIPVVVSDIPIFREIGGRAASYFPADSADELVARLLELENEGAWLEHSEAGILQARKFSWDNSALALIAALKAIQ